MDVFRGMYQPVPGRFARYFRIDFARHFPGIPKPSEMAVSVLEPEGYYRLPGSEYREAQEKIASHALTLFNEKIMERARVQNLPSWLTAKMTEKVEQEIRESLELGII